MTRTYECMFLIDNDAVRAGWSGAKASVAGLVEKHGGKMVAARHWDERRLAYPIRHRNRATYLLSYCEMEQKGIPDLRRELDISETVLRYLILSADEVPAKELELSNAEDAKDFVLPEPPADDEPEPEPEPEPERPRRVAPAESSESKSEPAAAAAAEGSKEESKSEEAKPEEAKPEESKPEEATAAAEPKAEQESPEAAASSDGEEEKS